MLLLRLCDAFDAAGVRHAIAGGYAVALHGAVRGTVDVDLVLRLREEDFVKAERVLNRLGLQSRQPVSATEVFRFREEYIRNRNMRAWSFSNPSNPAEIVDILIAEDLSGRRTVKIRVQGRSLSVLSKKDLIEMKTRSGRPQDLEDVAALKRLGRQA